MSSDMESYSEIKPEFDKCYDKEFNQIFNSINSAEQKILTGKDALDKVKNGIIPTLNKKCEKVEKLINNELASVIEPAASKTEKAFPINFNENDYNNIKKWKNKIIALEGKVVQLETSNKKTPYIKLKIGSEKIWVISMIDYDFKKVGNSLKILGYLIPLEKNAYERKFNQDKYQILAFGILDLKTKELAYFPGSEIQMKEWKNGKIPSSEE